MSINIKRSEKAITVVALASAIVLIFGSAGVVKASNNAKPGDALYPVDKAIENVRLGLTKNPESLVNLRTELVAERLSEAQQILVEQGAGASGIDIALSDIADQKAEIAKLVEQNQELQSRVDELESQLDSSKNDLKDALKSEGDELENSLQEAKDNDNSSEMDKIENEIKDVEDQKEALEEIEKVEPKETPEPKEPEENESGGESEESE